jgi:hypothetical protein
VTRENARSSLLLILVAAGALAISFPAGARSPAICDPVDVQGGVSILVVATREKVKEFSASVRDARIVRRDAETVLFEDGRVVTSNVEALGGHLNALGWGQRSIAIVGSFSTRRARRPG